MRPAHRAIALLAAIVGLVLLVGVRPASADVLINEFSRSTGIGIVEIVNTGPGAVDVDGWFVENQAGSTLVFVGVLAPGDYQTQGGANFILDSGQIELFDFTLPVDVVAWGIEGGAPAPLISAGFSTGRSPDGVNSGDFASDWNIDPSQTLGAANDHLSASLGGAVSVNEIGRAPGVAARAADGGPVVRFELFNDTPSVVFLDQWFIADGRRFLTLSGGLPPGGFLDVIDSDGILQFGITEVAYLVNSQGRRVDQIGTNGAILPPTFALSFQRIPDGGGPHNGFNYVTSGGSVTWAIQPQTFGESNGPGPVTGVSEAVLDTTWGRVKSLFR